MMSIDQRPAILDTRRRLGDWDVNSIIGSGDHLAIVSLTKRNSCLALLRKVDRQITKAVTEAVTGLLKPLSVRTHKIRADKGKEYTDHERIATYLQTGIFFVHTYSSWERATNENTIGLICQYLPRKRNFVMINQQEIEFLMERLNNHPGRCLGFKSPNPVFFNYSSVIALRN